MPQKARRQYRHLPAFILLILAEAPAHGAGVHAALTRRIQDFKPDTAAVYRALQALETQNEVLAQWDTSGSGPARKVYSLTPAGLAKLADWKVDIEHRVAILSDFLRTYQALGDRLP